MCFCCGHSEDLFLNFPFLRQSGQKNPAGRDSCECLELPGAARLLSDVIRNPEECPNGSMTVSSWISAPLKDIGREGSDHMGTKSVGSGPPARSLPPTWALNSRGFCLVLSKQIDLPVKIQVFTKGWCEHREKCVSGFALLGTGSIYVGMTWLAVGSARICGASTAGQELHQVHQLQRINCGDRS